MIYPFKIKFVIINEYKKKEFKLFKNLLSTKISSVPNINNLVEMSNINFKENKKTDVVICTQKIGNHIMYYKDNVLIEDIIIDKSHNIYYSCYDELIFDFV